jgi:hypothetical protein
MPMAGDVSERGSTESIFIAGLGTADGAASSVAMQERCCPLYGEQSCDRTYSLWSVDH